MRVAKLSWLSRRGSTSALLDWRPCAICALAPKIALSNATADYGRYCLFFGVRIAPEEQSDANSALRKQCVRSGNHFTWPVRGYSAKEMLEWRVQHQDWSLRRNAIRVSAIVAVATLIVTVLFKISDWITPLFSH